jgi:plastocyanin
MLPGRMPIAAAFLFTFSLGAVPAHAATVEIEMGDLAFSRAVAAAVVGDTVVWVNKDIFAHTATAKNGAWKVVVQPGKKGSVVVRQAGTFDYYCEYHPTMKARLVISAPTHKKKIKSPTTTR